ncbi:hypothetical protein ATCC90586_009184 [Pythium insidiosum]|nr:hypothetical protein ATCC90586_009184 [Pythium insidiosum]
MATTPERRFRYLTREGAKNIQHYKYSGSDASLLYNYVISPSAQWLVDNVIPETLAPNAITISGLGLVIFSHICMLWFSPNMSEEAPRWVYANAGLCLLLYQVLDVADGKQARKTGNSSPLGLLFDHGCDALNVVISACTFASTVMTGPTYWSMLIFLSPAMVFFMATWEEYYTGTLALPIINGPNEGLAIMYSCYFATALVGPAFWRDQNVMLPTLRNNEAFVILLFVSAVGQSLLSAVIAMRSLNRKRDSIPALLGITPFAALIGLSALWVLWSPSDIFVDHPRLIMWTVGLIFAKMAMHMMLAHMCEEPFWLLRKTFAAQLAVAFLLVIGIVPWGHEKLVAELFFVLALGAYLHMVYFMVLELAELLDIYVFKVKKR